MVTEPVQIASVGAPRLRLEFGEFLRKRRHQLDHLECGMKRTSRRRTPGLRREEVAELAGISLAWYTRLEARGEVQPSTATLLAIALALRLTDVETDYLFELAGLAAPMRARTSEVVVPAALRALMASIDGAATLLDCYFTPLLWNDIAGAIFGYNSSATHFDRNMIVRALTDESVSRLFGADYENVAARAAGIFRRALATHRPTPVAQRIYEFATQFESFRCWWQEEAIVESVTAPGPFVRYHDVVGSFKADYVDLRLGADSSAILRILTPADQDSAIKFRELRALGSPFLNDDFLELSTVGSDGGAVPS